MASRGREHRAPKGAFRLIRGVPYDDPFRRQKAPSAKRCIMTFVNCFFTVAAFNARKHRAPKGALRHAHVLVSLLVGLFESESTESQKVH